MIDSKDLQLGSGEGANLDVELHLRRSLVATQSKVVREVSVRVVEEPAAVAAAERRAVARLMIDRAFSYTTAARSNASVVSDTANE